jgi:ElaB/YqjD/DUF883 family membrane-anchored ribosome-binding protein
MQNPGSAAKNDKMDTTSTGQKSNPDIGSALEGASKTMAGTVTSLKDGVSNLSHKAQEIVGDLPQRAQEYGERAVSETRSFVKNNPGQALLIGFGAGFLIGFAFSRK